MPTANLLVRMSDDAVLQYSAIMKLDKPETRILTNLDNFFNEYYPHLTGVEGKYVQEGRISDDLVALQPPEDEIITSKLKAFHNWVMRA
jgi:hypothetical protein